MSLMLGGSLFGLVVPYAEADPGSESLGTGWGSIVNGTPQVEAWTRSKSRGTQPRGTGGTSGGSGSTAGSSSSGEIKSANNARPAREQKPAFDACVATAGADACERGIASGRGLTYPLEPGGAAARVPAAAGVPAIDPVVIVRSALARLPIPMPEAKIGPDPSLNEWNMAAVGYPLWLWVDGTEQYSTIITEDGITLTLTANRQSTRFSTGDGNTKTCGAMTPWTENVEPGTPSPTCGHLYEKPSLPGGTYGVTATTVWNVEWTALGQSGTLPFERTGPATELPVGELHAVRLR